MVKRGEVWLAALDPTIGGEIQKMRPCVIISPDELNLHLRTIIAAPMRTGSRPAPFRVAVRFQGKDGLILPDQMRTIDKGRLVKKLGRIGGPTLDKTLRVLRELFADASPLKPAPSPRRWRRRPDLHPPSPACIHFL
jgi:mRNA interferase MazF